MGTISFRPVETVDERSLSPWDIYVQVIGEHISLSALTAPGAVGGDFLRLFYQRAHVTGVMEMVKSASGRSVTLKVPSSHVPSMHALVEIMAVAVKYVRLTGDVRRFYAVLPWKGVAVYSVDSRERYSGSYFQIVSVSPYGFNDATFKYLRNLGAWKKPENKNVWQVPMSKLFKFLQSNVPGERGVAVTRSLAELVVKGFGGGFDGSVLSLKDVPVGALHFARYDTRPQNVKREKGKALVDSMVGVGYGSVFDLLYGVPRRYLDLSNPASSLVGLDSGETAHVVGRVVRWEQMYSGRGMTCVVRTAETDIEVTFWGKGKWRELKFPVGSEVIVGGKISFYHGKKLTGDFIDTLDVSSTDNPFVPIYSQSPSRGVLTVLVSNLIREALTRLSAPGNQHIVQGEYWSAGSLPEGILPVDEALKKLHFPESKEDILGATDSLAWYELVWMQLLLREAALESETALGIKNTGRKGKSFRRAVKSLPYSLTGDQQAAVDTIRDLMRSDKPMNALLSADVGAGKTIVQILAALTAVDSGRQAVIVAPTEILAQQIYRAATTALENVPEVTPLFLSGALKNKERKEAARQIEDGSAKLIIGTHTILNTTKFADLGFVCLDEQQKFGVEQRERLLGTREDGTTPDYLLATATPIPRTIAQVAYGDIDFIQIKEKPAGRKPVDTEWVRTTADEILQSPNHLLWEDISKELEAGHQAFIVAPLVDENTDLDAPSVENLANQIHVTLPDARVGILHGKMKPAVQETNMTAFRNGETNVLIASTIVEVGVDIPNATRIIIMGAERMGASSLHQLRGRVGRNDLHAKCWLISPGETKSAQARMNALCEHHDGFAIAEADTETRGEGDVLTLNQHGNTKNRFLRLNKHRHLIASAQEAADRIQNNPEHLKQALADAKKFHSE